MPKAMWFFTVNLAERKNNDLLIDKIDELRNAFRYVKQRKPFHIDAIVIMPDHLHSTWMQEVVQRMEHLDITARRRQFLCKMEYVERKVFQGDRPRRKNFKKSSKTP